MPYIVKDIRIFMEDEGADSRPYYFFDANAWLAYLVGSDNLQGKRGEHYANLLEGIVYINGIIDSKTLKHYKFIPKIVVSSLLFSEIYNAYLHNIAYVEYLENSNFSRDDFKYKEYRKSKDFLKKKALMQANIEASYTCLLFIDDNFKALNPLNLIGNLPITSDFNDFFYYTWLKYIQSENFKISIVTDDSDFTFEDIEILTFNHTLRQLPKTNK